MALIPLLFKDSNATLLIQQIGPLTDCILSLPTIASLAHHYKHARIIVLCNPESAALFKAISKINVIIGVEKTPSGRISNMAAIESQIRAEYPSIYLELFANQQLALMAKKWGIKIRIGNVFSRLPFHFLTHPVRSGRSLAMSHQIEFAWRLASRLSTMGQTPDIPIPLNPELTQQALHQLGTLKNNTYRLVGVDISADDSGNRISTSLIQELATMSEDLRIRLVIFGTPHIQLPFLAEYGPITTYIDTQNLDQKLALISQVDVFIGHGCAVSQLANITLRKMIMILFDTSSLPARIGPLAFGSVVFYHNTMGQTLTSERMIASLTQVLNHAPISLPWSIHSIKTELLKTSLCVLWLVHSAQDYFQAVQIQSQFAHQSLRMVPIWIRHHGWGSIVELIRACRTHHVMIIHGTLNPVASWIVQSALKTMDQMSPIRVFNNDPLRPNRSAKDWLKTYQTLLDPASPH